MITSGINFNLHLTNFIIKKPYHKISFYLKIINLGRGFEKIYHSGVIQEGGERYRIHRVHNLSILPK